MDPAIDGGPSWDTGDDRSRAFAPAASVAPLNARAAGCGDISRFAANDEIAAAALFLRSGGRAAR